MEISFGGEDDMMVSSKVIAATEMQPEYKFLSISD